MAEFVKIVGMEPKALNLRTITRRAELGKEITGVLLKPSSLSAQHDFRELELSTSRSCALEEILVDDENRLREQQPADTFLHLSSDAQNADALGKEVTSQTKFPQVRNGEGGSAQIKELVCLIVSCLALGQETHAPHLSQSNKSCCFHLQEVPLKKADLFRYVPCRFAPKTPRTIAPLVSFIDYGHARQLR